MRRICGVRMIDPASDYRVGGGRQRPDRRCRSRARWSSPEPARSGGRRLVQHEQLGLSRAGRFDGWRTCVLSISNTSNVPSSCWILFRCAGQPPGALLRTLVAPACKNRQTLGSVRTTARTLRRPGVDSVPPYMKENVVTATLEGPPRPLSTPEVLGLAVVVVGSALRLGCQLTSTSNGCGFEWLT